MGYIALLYIFLMEWKKGHALTKGFSMSLLAMISFLFYQVNSMGYFGLISF